jgi:hypothetical protein
MRVALTVLLVLAAGPAAADSSYAIVVGSNQGGAGQTDLRFAEEDAARVGALLTELGGYHAKDITTITRPDPASVLAAIDAVAAKAKADVAAGTPTTVFFYYSGHAKATALNLGDRELALGNLRDKLLAIPSTLTVVVLDACQSGAFSRVKGAEPAADFSFNSKSRLDATGVAVLASSTGSELSQESDILKSSYFTHHLLVGLRGAADQSRDGRVTIDEAYRYAYHQTLLATAATAVGKQHVSLEVDLKGHGEVPLSYPQQATATLELPAVLAGDIMIERTRAQTVLAELHKVAGEPVRVAVAPGEYSVLVRRDKVLERCPVTVPATGTAVVDLAGCDEVQLIDTGTKGPRPDGTVGGDGRRLTVELTASLGDEMNDAFTDRLRDFGYARGFLDITSRLAIGGRWRFAPHVQLGGALGVTSSPGWTRPSVGGGEPLRFSFMTTTAIAYGRLDHTPSRFPRTRLYVQAGGGVGMGRSTLTDEADRDFTETSFGPVLTGSAGIEASPGWWRRLGLGLGYTFAFAPVITNLAGDRHLGVGHFLDLSAHYRF